MQLKRQLMSFLEGLMLKSLLLTYIIGLKNQQKGKITYDNYYCEFCGLLLSMSPPGG